jgi:hypothetical protein
MPVQTDIVQLLYEDNYGIVIVLNNTETLSISHDEHLEY